MKTSVCTVLAVSATLGAMAQAQTVDVSFARPSMDRWMYPFNFSRGSETFAACFAAVMQPGFDDRDAQFLLGFVTGGANPVVEPGLGLGHYKVLSARLTVTVQNDLEARYDPTWDSFTSLLPDGDPRRTVDEDPARPLEVFAAGYRNGWSLETFAENSTFGGVPIVQPAEGARNVFPALIAEDGTVTDVSRQVREGFDAQPLAIATTDAVAPGELIPAGTVMTFDFPMCDPAVRRCFADALNRGKLNLVVTSLEPTSGGPGGGTGDRTYPLFYTKEDPVNRPATLTMRVQVGGFADFNGDGFVDFFDYDAYITAFEQGC